MELLVIIITLALIFDYINGFHDAANSIATIVSTKVLTPFQAVIWAAFFNFVAFFIAKCIYRAQNEAYKSGRPSTGVNGLLFSWLHCSAANGDAKRNV